MRIAVIAANGRSGQAFVAAALKSGHTVRAGIRGDNPFSESPQLTVVQCDATNMKDIEELLKSSDIVVSLLGHVKGSPANVQTDAMRVVLKAMKKRGMKRIISLTGTGVRIPGDTPNLIDKIANAIILRIDPNRINDGIAHAKVLKASDTDFTILRVLKLSNGNEVTYQLNDHGPAKMLTSRAEVALALLDCAENNRFIRGYPVIVK